MSGRILVDAAQLREVAESHAVASSSIDVSRVRLSELALPELPADLAARVRATTHRTRLDLEQQRRHCLRTAADLRRRAALATLADAPGQDPQQATIYAAMATSGPVPGISERMRKVAPPRKRKPKEAPAPAPGPRPGPSAFGDEFTP